MTLPLIAVGFAALLMLGVPLAIVVALLGAAALVLTQGPESLPNLPLVLFESAAATSLLAVPLFLLAGAIMKASGMWRRLLDLACASFGLSRDGPAAAVMAAAAAALAAILPPSIPMILYAASSGSSVLDLFLAGAVPAALAGVAFLLLSRSLVRRDGSPVERDESPTALEPASKRGLAALALPIVILAGILGGLVTLAEGAALIVVATLGLGLFVERELDLADLGRTLSESAARAASLLLLVAASALLGLTLMQQQLPQRIAAAVLSVSGSSHAVLLFLGLLLLAVGCRVRPAVAVILLTPLLLPLTRSAGIDPVHFGLVAIFSLAVGQQLAAARSGGLAEDGADRETARRLRRRFNAFLIALLLVVTLVPAVPMVLVELFSR